MAGERRGRPRAADSADTRARVVVAAQVLFAERGYSGVSMDQLAAAAGVNVRAIYHYFPSKRALFEGAAAATFERYGAEVIERVMAHDDLPSRLHGFVDVYRSLYQHDRHLLAFLSVIMIESVNEARAARVASPRTPPRRNGQHDPLFTHAEPIIAMNRVLIEQACAREELAGSVNAEAAIALLRMIGMGLGLAALDDDTPFVPMLDALDLLIDGTLLSS
jgi:AcrR family transcriptional regulator